MTYTKNNNWRCQANSYALRPRHVTGIKTKTESVKLDKLGLGFITDKCNDAETGDLGVIATHKASLINVITLQVTGRLPSS